MSVAVSAASLDEASLENPKDAQYDSYLKYDSYLSRYADKNRGEQTILIPADTRLPQEDAAAQLVDSYKGAQNVLIFSGNGEKARWKFSVKKEGRYCVALTFYNMKTETTCRSALCWTGISFCARGFRCLRPLSATVD